MSALGRCNGPPAPLELESGQSCAIELEIYGSRAELKLEPGNDKDPFVLVEGKGLLQLPNGPSGDALARFAVGHWHIGGFVDLTHTKLVPIKAFLMSGVVVPLANVEFVSAQPGRIDVQLEMTPESFGIKEAVTVEAQVACDMLAARKVPASFPEGPETRPLIGEVIGERYLVTDQLVPISASPGAPPVLVLKPRSHKVVSLLEERDGWVRIVDRPNLPYALTVGWTLETLVSDTPPDGLRKTRIPELTMGSSVAPGKWHFSGLISCPHQLPLVAELHGVRRTIGSLAKNGVAFRHPKANLGSEMLLQMAGVGEVSLWNDARLFLEHKDIDRCFCDPSWSPGEGRRTTH